MRMISGRIRKVLGFLAACVVAVPVLAEEAYCPARIQLKPILKIGWRLGPDYPMGIQDSAFGFLRGQMVSAGGFTRHPLDIVTHYSDAFGGEASGFTKLAFALDPGQEDHGWRRVADIPGPARQGGAVAVVADAMYVMGGISYAEPYTYRDTYQLQGRDGTWAWRKLESCQLPWPVYGAAGSAAVIGSKIYLLGVADYFRRPVQRMRLPHGSRTGWLPGQQGSAGFGYGRPGVRLEAFGGLPGPAAVRRRSGGSGREDLAIGRHLRPLEQAGR